MGSWRSIQNLVALHWKSKENMLPAQSRASKKRWSSLRLPLSSGDGEFPDLRTVEYWNPKLTFSKGETTSFGFRLSDAKGVFILSLEGVTRQGTPVYGKVEFEVE